MFDFAKIKKDSSLNLPFRAVFSTKATFFEVIKRNKHELMQIWKTSTSAATLETRIRLKIHTVADMRLLADQTAVNEGPIAPHVAMNTLASAQPIVQAASETDTSITTLEHSIMNDVQLMSTLLRWNDSNHECLLFSNASHVVHFLSLDPDMMKKRMYVLGLWVSCKYILGLFKNQYPRVFIYPSIYQYIRIYISIFFI